MVAVGSSGKPAMTKSREVVFENSAPPVVYGAERKTFGMFIKKELFMKTGDRVVFFCMHGPLFGTVVRATATKVRVSSESGVHEVVRGDVYEPALLEKGIPAIVTAGGDVPPKRVKLIQIDPPNCTVIFKGKVTTVPAGRVRAASEFEERKGVADLFAFIS